MIIPCAPPPPHMPQLSAAMVYADDLIAAAERVKAAWNATQLADALNSVEFFTATIRAALPSTPEPSP